MEQLPKSNRRPFLEDYNSLEDKFNTMLDYLSMEQVIVQIPDMIDFNGMPAYDQVFEVTGLMMPQTSYIKRTVIKWLETFPGMIDTFLISDTDFQDITNRLLAIKNKCVEWHEKLNLHDDLTFEESFRYYVEYNGVLQNIPYVHLRFSNNSFQELVRHFTLRSDFFLRLAFNVEEKLHWHLTSRKTSESPYKWDSTNPELEVAELVHTLYVLNQRIKINEEAGGTFAKFKREFYGLFNLDDTTYNKSLQTIKKRQYKDHFLQKMAQSVNEYHAKVNQTMKKKSD